MNSAGLPLQGLSSSHEIGSVRSGKSLGRVGSGREGSMGSKPNGIYFTLRRNKLFRLMQNQLRFGKDSARYPRIYSFPVETL